MSWISTAIRFFAWILGKRTKPLSDPPPVGDGNPILAVEPSIPQKIKVVTKKASDADLDQSEITDTETSQPDPNTYVTFEQYLSLYETFRSYVRHEDALINSRMTWVLTIHGFLYATYGFSLQKILEIFAKMNDFRTQDYEFLRSTCDVSTQLKLFMLIISVVGLAVSGLGGLSILAAARAIKHISRVFRSQNRSRNFGFYNYYSQQEETNKGPIPYSPYRKNTEYDPSLVYLMPKGFYLPSLTGGGNRDNAIFGSVAAHFLPLMLFIGWGFSIYYWFHYSNSSDFICIQHISIYDMVHIAVRQFIYHQ